jgi:hypothetical protein
MKNQFKKEDCLKLFIYGLEKKIFMDLKIIHVLVKK